jgi:hypothetical protein
MICSSVNRERFICPSLSSGGLYSSVEEFQGVTSLPTLRSGTPSRVRHGTGHLSHNPWTRVQGQINPVCGAQIMAQINEILHPH